jgi:peptidoglycan/xylan/chitin deacetylase (PgdA/CDA1 family)
MYHYIRINPVAGDAIGADLSVPPMSFARQMMLLDEKHYNTITFDDLCSALLNGTSLPPNPIILTFDDGYEDFYTNAFPILQKLQMRATSFIITRKAGWDGYMSWDQMREIQQSGLVQFESHTVNHYELNAISLPNAQRELVDSKNTLEVELGTPVKYLSYPSGRFNSAVVDLAAAAGYEAAVTTEYGSLHSASDLLTLSRVRVHGAELLPSFAVSIGTTHR